jgi:hypothetical protein
VCRPAPRLGRRTRVANPCRSSGEQLGSGRRRRVSATKFGYERFGQTGAPQPRCGLAGPACGGDAASRVGPSEECGARGLLRIRIRSLARKVHRSVRDIGGGGVRACAIEALRERSANCLSLGERIATDGPTAHRGCGKLRVKTRPPLRRPPIEQNINRSISVLRDNGPRRARPSVMPSGC